MQKLALLAAFWLWAAVASAADVLYAAADSALYTVDLATGTLTFQSDGALRWIASAPAYDDVHHTAFWPDAYHGQYTCGNPITGEVYGQFPLTNSFAGYNQYSGDWPLGSFGSRPLYAYAQTTARLYSVVYYGDPLIIPIMIDQFNGPGKNWGNSDGAIFGRDWEIPTAMAFDPTTNSIVFAATGGQQDAGGSDADTQYGIRFIDPISGWFTGAIQFSHNECDFSGLPYTYNCSAPLDIIISLAVEPTTGDIFFCRSEMSKGWEVGANPVQTITLRRWDRALGQDFEICVLDRPLSLRFASDAYITP